MIKGEGIALADGQQVSEHYVGFEDGRIYYTKSGAGDALVLLHFNGGSGLAWEKTLPILSQHFTCYNIDLPGWGHSDVPSRQYSIDEMADSVITIMNDAGAKKAHFCGTHTGALLAFNIAARYPRRVGKLVLDGHCYYDTVGGMEFYARKILVNMTDTTSFDRAVYPKLTWEEAKDRGPIFFNSGAGMTQEEWERGEELRERRRYWQRLCYDSVFSYNSVPLVDKVTAPILLTITENDILRQFSEPAHRAIEGSILKVLKVAGGGVAAMSAPEEFSQEVVAFLKP